MALKPDRCRTLSALILALLFLLSCTAFPIRTSRPKGVYHRVQKGETLWHIAGIYRVNLQELAEINDISDPARIEADSVVFIPDPQPVQDDVSSALKSRDADGREIRADAASRVKTSPPAEARPHEPQKGMPQTDAGTAEAHIRKGKTAAPVSSSRTASAKADTKTVTPKERPAAAATGVREAPLPGRQTAAKQEPLRSGPPVSTTDQPSLQFDRKRFSWPVNGKVASRFGIQPNGMFNNGIKIVAPQGTMVKTAASGTVIYSSVLRGYGETIIVRHEDHYATVYTDLGSRLVRLDEQIKKGDRIAFMGVQGKGGDSFMMFEVRYRNKARNPLFFLP